MSVLARSPSVLLLLFALKIKRTANLPPKARQQETSQSRRYTERGMPRGPTRRNRINPPSIDPAEIAKTIRAASGTEVCRQLPRFTEQAMKHADFATAQRHRAIHIGRKYWARNAPSKRNSNARNVEMVNAVKSNEHTANWRQICCALCCRASLDSGDMSFPPLGGFMTFCYCRGLRNQLF